jgi:hypothetical protein
MNKPIDIGTSLLQDFMRHQSAERSRPLGGAAVRGRMAGMFVDNEILVPRRERATIEYLVDTFGGVVVEPRPLPPRPRELEGLPMRSVDGMPEWVRVKINGERVPLEAVERLAAAGEGAGLELSSESAAGTLAVSLMLRDRGLRGRLNHAGMPHAFPLLTANEGGGDNNPFNWPEYNGKSNITRAWQLCQALDNVRSLQHPIFIGILDMGFSNLTTDYAVGPAFSVIEEATPVFGAAP